MIPQRRRNEEEHFRRPFQHADIPEAILPDSQVMLQVDEQPDNTGRVRFVEVRPVRRAGDDVPELLVLDYIASTMSTSVFQSVRRLFPNSSNEEIQNRIHGNIIMYNWNSNNTGNSRRTNLEAITGELLLDMFDSVKGQGSNLDLRIYDIIWSFWINPVTDSVGSCSRFKNEHDIKGLLNWEKKPKYYADKIGCGALALCRGHDRITKKFCSNGRYWYDLKKFSEWTLRIQNLVLNRQMDLPLMDMNLFIQEFKSFSVVVFTDFMDEPIRFIGAQYVCGNEIFIFFTKSHFALITDIKLFLESARPGYNLCTCLKIYKVKCECEQSPILEQCVHCKLYHRDKDHVCNERICPLCELKSSIGETHRCPLFIRPSKIQRSFIGDKSTEFKTYKTSKQLWVWDIESHFVPTLDTTNYYHTNDDGTFKTNGAGLVVSKITKMEQLPNYICAMNVFTNEEKVFTEMEKFIDFFMENNEGYNLLIAHNSSGYDTRLLFDVAVKKNILCRPIFNGGKFMMLKIGNCTFHDSRFHLNGSLASLGKSFKLPTVKGNRFIYSRPFPSLVF